MKIHRIYGLLLRYFYLFKHSVDRWADVFYWPIIELLLWGITSLFIQSLEPGLNRIIIMIVSGIILWHVVWRGQIEVSINILEELWNRNLVNIFVAPVKFSEWIASFLISGIIKLIVGFSFIVGLAFILYKVNILSLGLYLAPFIALLLMSGWWIGILVGAIILRFGTRIQNLAWSFAAAISPFSAVYYPVSILPGFVQKIAWCFPTTYIFEGMRQVIFQNSLDPKKLYISLLLNIIYLILSLFILKLSFRHLLKKGLVKTY